jgi:acylphosphatase
MSDENVPAQSALPSTEGAGIVRAHVWLTGRVQGVGFRAHVEYSAQRAGVTGWVRNVGYEQVEAVAEGPRGAVEAFIAAARAGPRASRVDDARVEWEMPTGEFTRFSVRGSL